MPIPPFRYRIASVTQRDFRITHKNPDFTIETDNVNFNVAYKIHWLHEEKSININCIVKYLSKVDNEQLLILNTDTKFYIENYEDVIKVSDNNISTPDNLLTEMFGTSVDTSRGIILVRTEASYLSNVLLGTFDPKQILAQMQARRPKSE